MDNGIMCYTGGGTIDGINGDHVLLAPAFTINETIVNEMVEKMCHSIDKTVTNVMSRMAT